MRGAALTSLLRFFARVVVALVVLVSANHCFLEEGLRDSVSQTQTAARPLPLDHHFGAGFPHQHSPMDSESPNDDHPHGDVMSTHSEALGVKHRKVDQRVVSLALFLSVVIDAPASTVEYHQFLPSNRGLSVRHDREKSLISLSIAAQGPPRLV